MGLLGTPIRVLLLAAALYMARDIRLYAIREYGTIIHELDPWFNYRAAEYLSANGGEAFFKWFDHMSWYPLGRPIGTTIYPGMQYASVGLQRLLTAAGTEISVNDACAWTPVWFGMAATVFLALLTREVTASDNAGAVAALLMAIVPAHLMRSVGGGYDNECVAVTCLCATFYLWCRSLRTPGSWWIGALAGISYFCMAATWGGYIFVTNMVAVHAAAVVVRMVLTGTYNSYIHRSYSLYFIIGTALAVRIPVISWTPLRSLEQLSAAGVFGVLQVLEVVEWRRQGLAARGKDPLPDELRQMRIKAFALAGVAAVAVIMMLAPTGYFGPLSSRVRGLLVPHTRTGNPLVDSVSEHQPASPQAYYQMLHYLCFFAPVGFIITVVGLFTKAPRADAKLFLVLHMLVTYHFSSKMNRLLLLMGPVTAALAGTCIAAGGKWAVDQIAFVANRPEELEDAGKSKESAKEKGKEKGKEKPAKKRQAVKQQDFFNKNFGPFITVYKENHVGRAVVAVAVLLHFAFCGFYFFHYAHNYAQGMSNPQIIYTAYDQQGTKIHVRDYIDAYHWLRDNTPKDARVIAWWDYGYQITGIGERTSIADGNTWNHEHIATLGRCLTSPVKRAHENCVRHLADYVLVWAGGGHDDLSKSPHMARIGNSVYSDICPGDPLCTKFGFHPPRDPRQHYTQGDPTEMMANSLLYQVITSGIRPGVEIDPSMFQHAHSSKYGKVRIFKVMNVSSESKTWLADPANRLCDAPGSWYCPGQYPPAMRDWLKNRKAFRQLEDFNAGQDTESEEYHRSYMSRMARGGG